MRHEDIATLSRTSRTCLRAPACALRHLNSQYQALKNLNLQIIYIYLSSN